MVEGCRLEVKKLRRISRLDDLRPHYEITLHPLPSTVFDKDPHPPKLFISGF
jgi:hypothetical protein